jgi:hypothetical protein
MDVTSGNICKTVCQLKTIGSAGTNFRPFRYVVTGLETMAINTFIAVAFMYVRKYVYTIDE